MSRRLRRLLPCGRGSCFPSVCCQAWPALFGGMWATANHACHSVIVQPHSCLLPVDCSALDKVQPRAVSYEEQVAAIREQLAALYESQVLGAG